MTIAAETVAAETIAADDYPLVDLFVTFVLFFGLLIYFWLLVTVFADLFRRDVSGWVKTAWTLLLIVLPLVGALAYLITQGHALAEREDARARRAQQRSDAAVHAAVTAETDGIEQVARAKRLLDEGALTQEEFDRLKRRVLV
ncbi:SHOCT domain-containing protein [Blastococcus sp. SYSU D00695]